MIGKPEDTISDQEETKKQNGKYEQAQEGICCEKEDLVKVEWICCIHDKAVHWP